VDFSITNYSTRPRTEVARVSIPVPQGALSEPLPGLVLSGKATYSAQAHVITRHPDESPRRVMLSIPVAMGAGQTRAFSYGPQTDVTSQAPPAPRGDMLRRSGASATMTTRFFTLVVREDSAQIIGTNGEVLALIHAYGPGVADPQPAAVEIIENGPYSAWLRWRVEGSDWSREVDIQADELGRIKLTQRILRHLRDDDSTPDFGFKLSVMGAEPVRLPAEPVHFLQFDPTSSFAEHPELVASLKLADGIQISLANPLALRQNRGTLEADVQPNRITLRASRIEPVEEENNYLVIQEGAWRVMRLVIQPGPPEQLAAAIDQPLVTKTEWQAFDTVYHSGPPLRVEHPVLQSLTEAYIHAMQSLSRNGDDWGTMGGLDRYNHCQYVWEDYFRTGDPRLRKIALDWSENYMNFSVYWGPEDEYYGGGRYPGDQSKQPWPGTFKSRYNNAVSFCTKGYQSFWLAYEETGDPRFRHAAEQQALWASKHVTAGINYTRCIGQVTDYVKLYEYTGDSFYLDTAERLWSEFQECQGSDLLFTEGGRPAIGNHLHIFSDQDGYKTPFVKSYIMQYATNALLYLLKHHPDNQRLRDTIIACNDWMAKVQTPGGGWGYPGPSTGGLGWNVEYCHGLMLGCELEPKVTYLDAVQRDLRAIVSLFDMYGAIPSGIQAWESVAGISGDELRQMYHLATDRDRLKDFTDGKVSFGYGPDSTVYFMVLLRDYLKYRDEASLFSEDEILSQILQLPTTLAAGQAQSGDPSLRIKLTHSTVPEGTRVRLAVVRSWKLKDRELRCRWEFSDGQVVESETVERTFPAAGQQKATLVANDGTDDYVRTIYFETPIGPADIGRERWPQGVRIQAEAFSAQGGGDMAVQIRQPREKRGSDGGSFSHWDATGAWVEWEVDVSRAGHYFLLVKYARPAGGRRLVTVDGAEIGSIELPSTGGYSGPDADDWVVALLSGADGRPVPVELPPGKHLLRLTNNDSLGCNLDYVELLPIRPQP